MNLQGRAASISSPSGLSPQWRRVLALPALLPSSKFRPEKDRATLEFPNYFAFGRGLAFSMPDIVPSELWAV